MAGNIFDAGAKGFADVNAMSDTLQRKRADFRAAPMIAGGNFGGAAAEYGAAGLPDQARQQVVDQQTMQDRTAASARSATADKVAEAQRKAKQLIGIAQSLKTVQPGQRMQALQQQMPVFQQLGLDTSTFSQLDEAHLTDQSLDQFSAALGKEVESYTLGPGQTRFENGNPVASVEADQKYMPVPAGGALVPVPRTGGVQTPAVSPAAATSPPAALATLASEGVRTTSGLRTPEHNAAVGGVPNSKHLTGQARDLVPPPGATLAQLGDEVRRRMPGAKVIVESDHVHVQWDGGAATAAPADGLPPGTIRGPAKPAEWTSDGKGNLLNANGDRKVDPTFEGGSADPNIVKMLIEGRYPVPTGRSAVDPRYLAALQAAAAQDPGFDAANYPTRVKTRQSFLNGKDADNVKALNTVVGHLDALDKSIDGLGNLGGFPGSQLNNQVANMFAKASGTNERFADFDAKKIAVANELVRVFRGAGGAEADIQGYLKQLDSASSPKALHTSVRAIAELIKSRLDAVADAYKQGMGLSKDSMEFLHPEQARAFARLSGQTAVAAPASSGGWSIKPAGR